MITHCQHCGEANDLSARFCSACGQPTAAISGSRPAPAETLASGKHPAPQAASPSSTAARAPSTSAGRERPQAASPSSGAARASSASAGALARNAGGLARGASGIVRGAAPLLAAARDWAAQGAQRLRQALGGAADAAAEAYPGREERRESGEARTGAGARWAEWAGVAALSFVALAVRVSNLELIPPGFQNDEGEFAFQALAVARGQDWPGAWTSAALGSPAGMTYPQALLFRLLEPSVAAVRLPSALLGAAAVPAAYFLMRQLFSMRAAFLAAALVTFHVWFMAYSRIAFGAMPAAFCFIAAMGMLLAGVRTSRWQIAAAGGAVFACGLYVYQSFIPLALATWALLAAALLLRKDLRRKEVYWFFGVSLAAGAHFVNLFFFSLDGRVSQAQGFYNATPLSPLPVLGRLRELISYAQSPTAFEAVTGTGGSPLLNPATALFFWLGLGVLLLFIRRGSAQVLLLGWLVAAAPAVIAPDSEARRYLAGIFFLLAIAAVGLDFATGLLLRLWRKQTQALPIPILAGWAGAALAAALLAAFVWLHAAQHERAVRRLARRVRMGADARARRGGAVRAIARRGAPTALLYGPHHRGQLRGAVVHRRPRARGGLAGVRRERRGGRRNRGRPDGVDASWPLRG